VATAVILGGGGIAWATSGSSGHYRTATASVGDVESTLGLSGTVASSSRRDLSFGVAGDLASMKVEVGDEVTSGQTLATLDPDDLDDAIVRAKADLAKARAQLESDQETQVSTVTAAAAASTSSASSAGTATTAAYIVRSVAKDTSSDLDQALATLQEQQKAVTTAQTAAIDAITAAKAALQDQGTACAVDDSDTDDTDDTAVSQACSDALAAVQAAQDVVADKQDALQDALTELTDTLSDAIDQLATADDDADDDDSDHDPSGQAPTDQSPTDESPTDEAPTDEAPSDGAPSQSGGASQGQSGGGSASGGASGGSSAGSIASDQAAIDTAAAALTEAQLARKSATLTAPFAGTVLDVQAAKGDAVGASDVVVIIAGDGGSTVTTTVTVDQVPQVEKGQIAHVTPAGADEPVDGTVTEIGMLPTSGDTVTYPVTIDLADDVTAPEGAGATIDVVTGTVTGAVTVPSSAVTTAGRTTVTVLADGTATPTPVTVGVVGSTRTSITDGLDAGQTVVLADLDAALPSGDDTAGVRGFGTGGGPPSGVRPGGGGAGAAPGGGRGTR
jgi:HlyD family secretion protein